MAEYFPWINDPVDYKVDTGESSFSINRANKAKLRMSNRANFSRMRDLQSRRQWKNLTSNRNLVDRSGVSTATTVLNIGRVASKALAPIAIMATAMEAGHFAVQSSFDRSILQDTIKGGLDIFVAQAPMIISFAAFGGAEKFISGKMSGGSAGGFLGKRFGQGGGLKAKALSFAGGLIAATLSTEILKPIQEMIGGAIAGQRTSGLMASIAKGSTPEMEASIRKMAEAKGITSAYGVSEFAKGLKLPTSIRSMTTSQIKEAQKQLKADDVNGGFWNAVRQGRMINWSEESSRDVAKSAMRQDLTERREELYTFISDNNKQIIDWYSRE